MILVLLLIIPLLGGLIAWALAGRNSLAARWVSLAALILDSGLVLFFFTKVIMIFLYVPTGTTPYLDQINVPWIPQLGINFHLAVDGLSLLMVLLTLFLGIISVACSWTEIHERVGFFHFILMATITGILGVFLAMDLMLFYFFWELMLVPMYFLIGIWGHENRYYAAVKFL